MIRSVNCPTRAVPVVLLAGVSALALAPWLATAPASAAVARPAVSHARPHAGTWTFFNTNGEVDAASVTVTKGGKKVKKISVKPDKDSGCASKLDTVPGSHRITKGGNYGDTWHVGTTTTADGRISVTVHQGSKRLVGELYVDFESPKKGRGELIIGPETDSKCDLYFGIAAPKHST
jgi:hypothetical protein